MCPVTVFISFLNGKDLMQMQDIHFSFFFLIIVKHKEGLKVSATNKTGQSVRDPEGLQKALVHGVSIGFHSLINCKFFSEIGST